MKLPRRLHLPILLLLLPAMLPALLVLPEVITNAENSVGIIIEQKSPKDPVRIVDVYPHSPAERAGLKANLAILAAQGQPIRNLQDVNRIWSERKPKQPLVIKVQKGDSAPQIIKLMPGIEPDLEPLLLNILGSFYFLGLIALLLPQWKNRQARVLLPMLMLLSTDFILPYGNAGSWDNMLWRFNLFNLISVNILLLHFILLFPRPFPQYERYKNTFIILLYGLMMPVGFLLAATVNDPGSNLASIQVYRTDTILALISWLMLTGRLLTIRTEPEKTLTRWVWFSFTPLPISKLIWYLVTYHSIDTSLPVDLFVQTATILTPTGIFLALGRLDYLQAGKRISLQDISHFFYALLALLGLIATEVVYGLIRDLQPALATPFATIAALLSGMAVVPVGTRLSNWFMRGLFARPDQARKNMDLFFEQNAQIQDENRLLKNACQFLHEKIRVPWAVMIYCSTLKEKHEVIAFSQPMPFDNMQLAAFVDGVDKYLMHVDTGNQSDNKDSNEWKKDFGIEQIMPISTASRQYGHLLYGNSSEQPKTVNIHQKQDIELFLDQFALLLEHIQLEKTAEVDELTGALRREAGLIRLHEELARSIRKQQSLTLALLDLDWFKKINDTHGHLVGDQVLKDITQLIRRNLRQRDFICRYGGEEFLLVLPYTDHQGAQTALSKILEKVRNHYIVYAKGEKKLRATLSAGSCTLEGHKPTLKVDEALITKMIKQADRNLYQAKEQGRDRFLSSLFHF